MVNADGTGQASIAIPGASQADFAPDGRHMAYLLLDAVTRTDIWTSPLDRSAPAIMIRKSPAFEFSPRVSPDGKFVAYASSESGKPEVYVADYPAARRRWQVSDATGGEVQWNPKGGELFYFDALGQLRAVTIDPSGQAGKPVTLFSESVARAHLSQGYSPSADGTRFLLVRDIERGKIRPRITVVENWFVEFAAKR
jgi:Tol biopolymer transport system component